MKRQKYINSKDSEIKTYPLCLENFSGNFSANNTKKISGLNECAYNFSVGYSSLDASNIINVHKYLVKKHNIK